MADLPHACSAQIRGESRWPRFYPCENKAIVEREGKWFCGVHDPEKHKTRVQKSAEKYAAENEYRAARRRLVEEAIAVTAGRTADLQAAVARFSAAHQACVEHGVTMWKLL